MSEVKVWQESGSLCASREGSGPGLSCGFWWRLAVLVVPGLWTCHSVFCRHFHTGISPVCLRLLFF